MRVPKIHLALVLLLLFSSCLLSSAHAETQGSPAAAKDKVPIAHPPGGDDAASRYQGAKQALVDKFTASGFTLSDAVRFALEYNLDAAAVKQERAILTEARTAEMMTMLPSLILNAERSWRDRDLPVESINAKTGQVSLAPSISSEKETRTESIELSWDILNFAVGYVSYRQSELDLEAAKAHIERVKQNLALDVTRAYMKAVAAKSVLGLAEDLKKKAQEKRAQLARQMDRNLVSEVEGLESDINLIKILIKIQEYKRAYEESIIELAQVMGWNDPKNLSLKDYAFEKTPGYVATPVQELERKALAARPELKRLEFQRQHAEREGEKALYEAIPSFKIYGSFNHDANKYMTEHQWFTFGLQLSWDLLGIPEKIHASRAADQRERKVVLEKKAMEISIATQVRLAVVEQKSLYQRFGLVKDLDSSRLRLVETLRVMVEKGKTSQALLLDAANKYLNAHLTYVNTYSKIIVAQARLRNALGSKI